MPGRWGGRDRRRSASPEEGICGGAIAIRPACEAGASSDGYASGTAGSAIAASPSRDMCGLFTCPTAGRVGTRGFCWPFLGEGADAWYCAARMERGAPGLWTAVRADTCLRWIALAARRRWSLSYLASRQQASSRSTCTLPAGSAARLPTNHPHSSARTRIAGRGRSPLFLLRPWYRRPIRVSGLPLTECPAPAVWRDDRAAWESGAGHCLFRRWDRNLPQKVAQKQPGCAWMVGTPRRPAGHSPACAAFLAWRSDSRCRRQRPRQRGRTRVAECPIG